MTRNSAEPKDPFNEIYKHIYIYMCVCVCVCVYIVIVLVVTKSLCGFVANQVQYNLG